MSFSRVTSAAFLFPTQRLRPGTLGETAQMQGDFPLATECLCDHSGRHTQKCVSTLLNPVKVGSKSGQIKNEEGKLLSLSSSSGPSFIPTSDG